MYTMGSRPLGTYREAEHYSVKELGFQFLNRRDRSLLQASAVRSALGEEGFLVPPTE
jgi:hypothetical protein